MAEHGRWRRPDRSDLEHGFFKNGENISRALDFYKSVACTCADLNSEACEFMNKRIEEDMKLPGEFMKCKTPVDAAQAQVRFFGKMLADYTEESQKMMRLMLNANPAITGSGRRPSGSTSRGRGRTE